MQSFEDVGTWGHAWAWGLPLIVATVVVHVLGLVLVRAAIARAFASPTPDRAAHMMRFAAVMGMAALLTTLLHLVQAGVWAVAYVAVGALPSMHEAMLYSLNAMTAYGHTSVYLTPHWQMLGALQALNGLMLFGLSTAFLYAMIQHGWPARSP